MAKPIDGQHLKGKGSGTQDGQPGLDSKTLPLVNLIFKEILRMGRRLCQSTHLPYKCRAKAGAQEPMLKSQ